MSQLKKQKRKFSKIGLFFTIFLASLLILVAVILISFARIAKNLPSFDTLNNRQIIQSTKIFDRTGEILLYEIHGEEKRTVIPPEAIPQYIKQATIAIEDAKFFEHPAFDWQALVRALFTNILRRGIVQGGSTITQQLVKNLFLTPERTLSRKMKELVLAFQMEKRYPKEEILNLYLNQVPYGSNSYGIEAASQTYFNKSAKDLNIAEAALLAALTKAPSYYSPYGSHKDELIQRKDYILERMHNLGFIDEEEKIRAQKTELKFVPETTAIKAPHFVFMVRDYLNTKYGEAVVEQMGLRIITTLDWHLQEIAEKLVKEGALNNEKLYQGKNAALVAQDANTGQILALVGSKDYFASPEPKGCTPGKNCQFDGNFNVASQGLRQPGSAFKPFVYVTAFKKGYTPETVIFDVPTEFDTTKNPQNSYRPENYDQKFRGPVDFRHALAQSINVPSVKVLYLTGINNAIKTAQDFGITTLTDPSRYGLSLVLGGGEVKLIDMVGGYSVFAQEGIRHQQSIILEITDAQGKVLERYQDYKQRVIDPQYANLINDILSDDEARVPLFRPNSLLNIPGYETAVKTGTTNNYRDAWVIGYTPSLVVGVWAGNNDNSPMQRGSAGILAAVPIWHNFMAEALNGQPVETFNKPDPILALKPVLRGEYIVNRKGFVEGEPKVFPQIHTILFDINKDDPQGSSPENPMSDPQFENWEKPVLDWAAQNLSNFSSFNQPLPPNFTLTPESNYQPKIEIQSPANESSISGNVRVEAVIQGFLNIKKINLWFNESLISSKENIGPTGENKILNYTTEFYIRPENVRERNILKLEVEDIFGDKKTQEITLLKTPS